jgi:bifunctional enzyme CysN/CysC
MSNTATALKIAPEAKVSQSAAPMKIVVVGHVDHGKSTLVGRILNETGALPEGKVEYLREVCDKRGMPFEWAFVMDALQAERDQGITIDTAQIRFKTEARPYVIIDAPGHKEFLKNMVSGAASAEAAVLVIDAHEGVQEQSRRHGYLLHLLGLRQIAVAVNKMDLVDFSQDRFEEVKAEIVAYLNSIGVEPTHVIPVAARSGANIAVQAAETPWYRGPSVLGALDGFEPAKPTTDLPLRFPVQDVYKFDERRIIAGRIESGRLKVGDTLVFAPSGKMAKVATIETWGNSVASVSAGAGQSVGITLDEQIFVERGNVASLEHHTPHQSHNLKARVFWLGRGPLRIGSRYKLKLATAEHVVDVVAIERVIDVEDLANHQGSEVARNAVAEVVFRAKSPIAHDSFIDNPRLGRFVLVEGYDIVGGGVIAEVPAADETRGRSTHVTKVPHKVDSETRAIANGHRGGVVWLTGLSGAGKSTLAMEVERQLFLKGWQVTVLDGDNVRTGLCGDLGFSAADRTENIRRVGHVAHLLAEAGMLVITSFISPFRSDRDRVRAINPDAFNEIHVATAIEECERRDPKGLYRKARAGEIPDFTGVSSPYEPPLLPELSLDTGDKSVDETVADLLRYIEKTFSLTAREQADGWGL